MLRRPVISSSLNQIRPALGFISPEINRNSVVFPAPFGPMIDRSSPAYTREVHVIHGHQAAEGPGERFGAQQDGTGHSWSVITRHFACQG